jgi:hypothetical protein
MPVFGLILDMIGVPAAARAEGIVVVTTKTGTKTTA